VTLENKEIQIKKHFFTYSFVEMIAPFTIKNLSKIKFKKNKNDKMQTTFYHNNAIIEEDDFAEYKQNLIKFINISGEILNFTFDLFSSSWFQKYSNGQHHPLHIHGTQKTMYSLIHYLKVSKKSSTTNFYPPGYPYLGNEQKIKITPENNKIIIFPSWIPHEVEYNNDIVRTIFSANFYVNPNETKKI